VGTESGDIRAYQLPSHSLDRIIRCHRGPVTHLTTLLAPSDLLGLPAKGQWPIMEIKPLERMKANRQARETREVTILLGAQRSNSLQNALRLPARGKATSKLSKGMDGDKVVELVAENQRLRAHLEKAIKINDRMWKGIVETQLASAQVNGE